MIANRSDFRATNTLFDSISWEHENKLSPWNSSSSGIIWKQKKRNEDSFTEAAVAAAFARKCPSSSMPRRCDAPWDLLDNVEPILNFYRLSAMSKTSHLPLMNERPEVTTAMPKHPDIPALPPELQKCWWQAVPRSLALNRKLEWRGKTFTSIVPPFRFQRRNASCGLIMILPLMTVSTLTMKYLRLLSPLEWYLPYVMYRNFCLLGFFSCSIWLVSLSYL